MASGTKKAVKALNRGRGSASASTINSDNDDFQSLWGSFFWILIDIYSSQFFSDYDYINVGSEVEPSEQEPEQEEPAPEPEPEQEPEPEPEPEDNPGDADKDGDTSTYIEKLFIQELYVLIFINYLAAINNLFIYSQPCPTTITTYLTTYESALKKQPFCRQSTFGSSIDVLNKEFLCVSTVVYILLLFYFMADLVLFLGFDFSKSKRNCQQF